ncbi:MAG: ABC transporter substrate-binding protein [Microbacteriaceae bacterium]
MTQPHLGNSGSEYRKKNRSKLPLIIGAVAAVAVVTGGIFLAQSLSKKPAEDAASELTIGILLPPTNLDIRNTSGVALDQVLADNVYQGLIGFVPGTLELREVLAKSYTVSDDGKRYEFTLRDDVTFHSGASLTAEDVITSLSETLGDTVTVSSPSEGLVVIELAEPNAFFPFQLAGREGLILEAAATNDLKNTANGTGPYTLDSWKEGDSITLVKNEQYWGTEASLDRAVYRYISDGKAAVNASLDGDLDAQIAVLPSLVPELEQSGKFTLVNAESSDVFTLGYNNAKAPFDDERVRTAFSQAIDNSALVEALQGDAKPLGGPITSLEPGYEDLTSINAYDPDNARALLEEAGASDLSVTVTVPNFYDTVALDIVKSQLAEVGVTLNIKQVEFGTWLEDVYTNHDFDLSFVDHAEPFDFGNYADSGYYFGFDNAEAQQLYAEALKAPSTDEMSPLLAKAARVVAEEAPAKWLYNYTPTNAVAEHVRGFPESNTNSRINLEGVTIEK